MTFLFTDVEGSTRLWEQHLAGMRAALAIHDELVRNVIVGCRGHVFGTAGDSFAAAFWTPHEAVAAATEIQRTLAAASWPSEVSIQVRIGLDTGIADERGGDYFGPALNRTARLMSAAHGGQVVLSSATARLLVGAGLPLTDLGIHELSGLGDPERVWQLELDSERRTFPALRTARWRGNLPSVTTSFLGREEDLAELSMLLVDRSLVTLTGVGGVGKTRLALAAAEQAAPGFPDGVWFVDLAAVPAGGDSVPAAAEAFGVQQRAGSELLDSVLGALAGRRCLIVLDNCEHVVESASRLAAALAGAPPLRVLATSREPLNVTGEQVRTVAALPAADATRLLAARGREAGADDSLDSATLAEVCDRLDRIPLAIELAAARLRTMAPQDVLDRLHHRFRLLVGTRSSTERHSTLRATVSWSYSLLTNDEQQVLDELSVFAGSFGLPDAEAVCGAGARDPLDVDDLVSSLTDKSMIARDATGYRLLETLRQFADEQLAARGERDTVRRLHLDHHLSLAAEADAGLSGVDEGRWAERIERSWPNLRSAFAHACDLRDADAALRLVHHLNDWAAWRGRVDALAWAETALALPGASEHPLFAAAHGSAAAAAYLRGDLAATDHLSRIGLGLDPANRFLRVARCLYASSLASPDELLLAGRELTALAEPAGEAQWLVMGLGWQARAEARSALVSASVLARVPASIERAVTVADAAANGSSRAWARMTRGHLLSAIDPEAALFDLRDAIELATEARSTSTLNLARAVAARCLLALARGARDGTTIGRRLPAGGRSHLPVEQHRLHRDRLGPAGRGRRRSDAHGSRRRPRCPAVAELGPGRAAGRDRARPAGPTG